MNNMKQLQQIQIDTLNKVGIQSWIYDIASSSIVASNGSGEFVNVIEENVPYAAFEKNEFHPLDKKKVVQFYEDMKAGIPAGTTEARWHRNEADKYVWYRYTYTTIFEDEHPVRAYVIKQNIQNEKQLWEENNHLYGNLFKQGGELEAVLLRHMASRFYILLIADGNTGKAMEYLEHPNEGTSHLLEIEDLDVSSETYLKKYCNPEQLAAVIEKTRLKHVLSQLEEQEMYSFYFEGKNVKGERRYMKCECTYIHRESRQICFAFIDVTEAVLQKECQEEALEMAYNMANQAKQARENFLSNISHQIRTPMNAIVGMAEIAKMEGNDIGKIHECMDIILSSSHSLIHMVDDLLDTSQAGIGKVSILASPCEMSKLLFDIKGDFYSLYLKNGQNFIEDIQIKNSQVICDRNRLSRVLLNVLGNAAKFTPEGGNIWFKVWEEECVKGKTKYHFVIEDSGKGISKEDLEHVFEPFYRDSVSKEQYLEGNGLGLSVVKEILDAKGATIDIQSELGKGTRVEIVDEVELVLASNENENSEVVNEEFLVGRKVLLVEDQPINLMVAKRMLERYGAEVATAENGKAAVDVYVEAPSGTFDIIFMDIQMPVLNGYEAAKMIRTSDKEDARHVKIVSMTADVFPEDVQRASDVGMDAHIGKPIRAVDLINLIKKLLQI